MGSRSRWAVTIVLSAGLLAVAGCGGSSGQEIEIRYERPARKEVPKRIRSLALVPFEGKTAEDRRWGSVAADKAAALLDDYDRKYHRFRLVDRRSLKTILDEHRIKLAFSDPNSVQEAAKFAKVDAFLTGRLNVTARDEHFTRQVPDLLTRRMKTKRETRRTVNIDMTMQVVDLSSKTLVAENATRNYDSEKAKHSTGKTLARFIGVGGPDLSARDAAINDLLTECVHEVIGAISPHEEVVKTALRKGKSKIVDTGNKLAANGDYKEALDCYLAGIREKPDDDGALFNAALMYEVTGELAKAEEYYDRAFKLEPDEEYIRARKRVRTEGKPGG